MLHRLLLKLVYLFVVGTLVVGKYAQYRHPIAEADYTQNTRHSG